MVEMNFIYIPYFNLVSFNFKFIRRHIFNLIGKSFTKLKYCHYNDFWKSMEMKLTKVVNSTMYNSNEMLWSLTIQISVIDCRYLDIYLDIYSHPRHCMYL